MFLCDSGTIFGREVVPDVWSTSAMSSGAAAREPVGVGHGGPAGKSSVNVPAPRSGCATSRATGTPSFSATPIAGESFPVATTSSFALRSVR